MVKKSTTTARGFVVKQDAVAGEHVIGLAVVLDGPVGVKLSDAVRGARVERGGFLLGNLHDLAVVVGSPLRSGAGELIDDAMGVRVEGVLCERGVVSHLC